MSMSWYDPDQGRQVFEDICASLLNLGDTLHVPTAEHVWSAGQEALEDSLQAFTSGSHFCFIVAQPFVRMLGWVVYWMAWFVWKYILVEGLYNHGLSQAKEWFLAYWEWQTSLTTEELLLEGAVLLSMMGLYRLHLVLKRRRYFQKAAVWMDRKRRHGVKVSSRIITSYLDKRARGTTSPRLPILLDHFLRSLSLSLAKKSPQLAGLTVIVGVASLLQSSFSFSRCHLCSISSLLYLGVQSVDSKGG